MQFALAHQTASAEAEAELRSLIVGLQGESELSKDLVLGLESALDKSQQKVSELEEQIRWKELEFQNHLNIKEAKIQELKKALNMQVSTGTNSKDSTDLIGKTSSLSPFLKENSVKQVAKIYKFCLLLMKLMNFIF